jgi:hypothetical protein
VLLAGAARAAAEDLPDAAAPGAVNARAHRAHSLRLEHLELALLRGQCLLEARDLGVVVVVVVVVRGW